MPEPHSPDNSEAVRMIRLVGILRRSPGLTSSELATELGVNERSIKRYVRKLRSSGMSIESGRGGGYRIDGATVLTPVQLEADEAMAVIAVCQTPAVRRQMAALGSLERAVAKLTDQLSPPVRREVLAQQENLLVSTAPVSDSAVVTDVYGRMRQAIVQKREVRCQYDDRAGRTRDLHLQPYALYFGVRAWYVVGVYVEKREVRTLKLSRFMKVELTNETFTVPGSFSLEKHFGNAWQMIRGPKRYEVVLDFEPAMTETISDTLWHRTQQTEVLENGGLRFSCTVDGLDEIVWWVLSMGASCRVRKPAALRLRVLREAERIQSLYARRRWPNTPAPKA
jgi:hypothetical protein